jgi:arylformamidase
MSSVLIDLSHTIEQGMVTYKGLPAPLVCDYLSRERSREFYTPGTEFQIGKIEMVGNTGTYVDCPFHRYEDGPFHRYEDGKDLSQTHLQSFANLRGVVVHADFRNGIEIGKSFFEKVDVYHKAVLVNTNWSLHWRTDKYFENHPFLTEDAAQYLRDKGARLVGIDSHNIDDTRTNERPVHSTLLKADILIVEHLCNLNQVPNSAFYFNAVPPKIKGMGTFPVRAYAEVRE